MSRLFSLRGNMGVIPEKTEYKNVSRERATRFAESITQKGLCKRVTFTAASDKSHLDRYGFVCANKKVSVVYDLKARLLSVSAYDDIAPALKKLFDSTPDGAAPTAQKPLQKADEKQPPKANADEVKPKKKEKKKADEKIKKQEKQSGKQSKLQAVAQRKEVVPLANDEGDDSGGLTLKKYTADRFEKALKKISEEKKRYKLSSDGVADKGKATELVSHIVKGDGVKLKLRYMPKKQVLQLQGKHGALFDELRILLSEQTDYKAAVAAHIEKESGKQEKSSAQAENKNAAKVERQLKKLIPSAYGFLSEQSKIDFTIGVIELINSTAEHYDYSMLLLPPFRGLERLIFDLQRAQSVVVKMIGQAYEKENGQYALKASYRRKINSIVYAEVMAALYREYYEKRNYYAHSDSTGEDTRRISSRAEAQAVFTAMLEKVEYNCKKLLEIRFSV